MHLKGANSMAVSRLNYRLSLVSIGWAISLLCTNGLRKRSSSHVGPPFLAAKLFSCSVVVTIGKEL